MAAEKNFENKVKTFLKDNDCWFLKYWGGAAYTKSGIPDILACCKGKFLAVEVKAANGKPSQLQIYNLRKIHEAGGLAVLLYPKDFGLFQKLVKNPDNKELYEVLKHKWFQWEQKFKEEGGVD
jgi:hypothetical protein